MGEGEQKVCLAEPTLEIMEEMPLQVQMQLLGAMEDGEALEAEAAAEALVEVATIPLNQQEKGATAELVVMAAAAVLVEGEG